MTYTNHWRKISQCVEATTPSGPDKMYSEKLLIAICMLYLLFMIAEVRKQLVTFLPF
jgi:hypothetical protein